MGKRSIAIILVSFVAWSLFSCNENEPQVKQAKSKIDSVDSNSKLKGALNGTVNIDTLFLEEKEYVEYFDAPGQSDKRQNKAVLQFMWINDQSNQYLTLGMYPAKNHQYATRNDSNKSPLLVLRNLKSGSSLSLSDSLILGDQQLQERIPGRPSSGNILKIIKDTLNKNTNEQIVVFAPHITLKHLVYKIYVIPKPAQFSPPSMKMLPSLSGLAPLGISDPSPPATSLN